MHNKVKIKKFPSVWLDFRLISYSYYLHQNINIIKKHLTFYQQSSNSISSKYKRFSKNWWKRRKEAHEFYKYLNNKKSFNIDKVITDIINFFI